MERRGYIPGVKRLAVILSATYMALILYPAYLAGTAPGEEITPSRVMTYTASVVLSVGLGLVRLPEWRYALPWVVAGALTELDLVLRVAGDSGLFPASEFYLSVLLLASAQTGAIWIGYRVRSLRVASPGQ